jgi:hypothetical protein
VDYYKLATEVVNGKPISEIDDRDVRSTLLNLCVIRSQALAEDEPDKAEELVELIRAMNRRVQPPPIARRPGSALASSYTTEPGSPVRVSSAAPLSPGPRKPLTAVESSRFHTMIEDLLKPQNPGLDEESRQAERDRLLMALDHEIEDSLSQFDYDRVKKLHDLMDDVTHVSRPRIDERPAKRRAVRAELASLHRRQVELEERIEQMEAARDEKLAAVSAELSDKFAKEIHEIEPSCPDELDPHLFGRWTGQLLEMQDNAKRFARARDYDGAKTEHKRADNQQNMEIKKKTSARRTRVERLTAHKRAEQARILDATVLRLTQEADVEIRKVQNDLDRVMRMIRTTQTDLDALCRNAR